MTDADRLLQTYIERYEAGGSPDPSELLDQAEGAERARLAALIEGYLEHAAPRREWDPAAFEGSVAGRAVEMLEEHWEQESSALPAQLVALRKQKQLRRATLVEKLAEKLGFASEADRVAAHYNAMEHGQLKPEGISAKVYDALAGILGTTTAALREAGSSVAPSAGGMPDQAFARTIPAAVRADKIEGAPSPGNRPEASEEPVELDDLDRLFLGGKDE